jgi:UDP-3-O-[3-hydroxymyristoyl] glucosamine N-acyltransferase
MPVILDSAHAPRLDQLVDACAKQGVMCTITPMPATMPAIAGLGTLAHAGPSEISFLTNPRYQFQLAGTRAAAVLMTPEVQAAQAAAKTLPAYLQVICAQPYMAYALLARWFDLMRVERRAGSRHATAVIAADAYVDESASIGPHCVIESGARIGAGCVLGPACIIGKNSQVGRDSLLHARVTLYHGVKVGARAILHSGVVLGADGFGLAPDPRGEPGAWFKIAQLGGVDIGDDVEIGANTTVDRGALDDTTLGHGVKLDNQIMVAHNVRIGAHTAVAACVGIAGSTTIGARCTIGGAAMLSGHITLADDVHVSGGTAITSTVHQAGRYTGVYPYAEHTQWQKNAAVIQQLARLRKRVRAGSNTAGGSGSDD